MSTDNSTERQPDPDKATDEDVEGHKTRFEGGGNDDDVEGHKTRFEGGGNDDDVEGHKTR